MSPATVVEAERPDQYLTFFLGDEEYAVGILRVREILQLDDITRVPGAPRAIRGVINLRGAVVPVADLGVRFGSGESVLTRESCIVIVEVDLDGARTVMGVLADRVSQVIDLPASQVEAPPSFGTRVRLEHLVGMGRSEGGFVLILDVDRILSELDLEQGLALAQAEPAAVAAVAAEA